MARSSSLVLADLITASRLPSFRIGTATFPIPDPLPLPIARPVPGRPGELEPGLEVSDWSLEALTGRLVELSVSGASSALTAVTSLLLEAQLRREPAAWIAIGDATFYPPDMAEAGCDLENLPVVRVGDARNGARAADLLLRSGGFRLVVLDGVGSPYVRTRRIDPGRSRFYPGYGPAYSQNADRQALDALGSPDGLRTSYGLRSGSDLESIRRTSSGGREPQANGPPREARSAAAPPPGDGPVGRRYVSDESRGRGFPGGIPADGAGTRPRAASSRGRFDDPHHPETSASIPPAAQSRLASLTQRHRAVLVCITYKERGASSLGALVSLRGTGRVRKTAFDQFTWEVEVLKDKRRSPGWEHSGVCRGPTGLF